MSNTIISVREKNMILCEGTAEVHQSQNERRFDLYKKVFLLSQKDIIAFVTHRIVFDIQAIVIFLMSLLHL